MSDAERPLNPGWTSVTLGDICELKYGASLPARKRVSGPYRVYGSNGQVGTHIEPLISGPSIIVGRKGSVGKVHLVDEPCWPIDTTYYVEHQSITGDIDYLYYVLTNLQLGSLDKSSAIPGLNRNDVYSLAVALPPIAEQKRIVAILDEQIASVEKAKSAVYEELTLLDAMWPALLRRALSGEL